MIELNGHVSQIFRSAEKPAGLDARKGPQTKGAARKNSLGSGSSDTPALSLSAPSVINFEYVPSGRLNLNQNERQRLIDFFE